MIKFLCFVVVFLSFQMVGQKKPMGFYDKNGEVISKEIFVKSIDHSKNIDLYFENDSLEVALLVVREKVGQLDKSTFKRLKEYLSELTSLQIDSSKNILINYLSAIPKERPAEPVSNWQQLKRDYLKKLHKIADIQQYWIKSPASENTDSLCEDKINWITDKDGFFMDVFFRYEIPYGNFILIKPDGKFYFYLGEHGNQRILKSARRFF